MLGSGDSEPAISDRTFRNNPNIALSLLFAATSGEREIEPPS